MSANLDLVRSICSAWELGDFSHTAEWAHPDIEYVRVAELDPDTRRGLAGMVEGARTVFDAYEHVRFVIDSYRDVDDDRVLVLHHLSGRGKGSGLDIGQIHRQSAHVFHIRDGKVIKLVHYFGDRGRALADLGLEEEVLPEEPTTPALTELMRRSALPLTARDHDAAMRFWAPDGVFDLSGTALGTYEGHAAICKFFEEWISAYDEIQFEFEEVHDLGNGVAFAVPVLNARLVGSTGSVRGRYGAVAIWVDGLCERVTNYADIDQARAAAERLAQERG
jgi:ketosteroid isomerase-like protein